MAMKFRAHDTFFIRKGWLSKGMKHVHNRADVFVSRDENPTDVLGIGTNMVKALRYWLQAVGVTQEPTTGRRIQTFTDLGNQIYEHDRYIEELGTLHLLHYKLASNKEEATAWYYFFNEFKMTEFTREDFVSALQSYVLMSGEDISVALRSLNDDFACIVNTYLPFHEFKQELILQDRFGQVSITADILLQVNANPDGFTLAYLDWDPEKAEFIQKLAYTFSDYVVEAEKLVNAYDYVVSAMKRWYMALPKYAKELKRSVKGQKVDKRYLAMLRLLKNSAGGHELLFDRLPTAFGYTNQFSVGLAENITAAKKYYDHCIAQLKKDLIQTVKEIFSASQSSSSHKAGSLTSVIKDWCESLDEGVFEQLFNDGTEKCLGLLKTATNDEETLIARLAKTATDLRLEDWDSSTYERFVANVKKCKATAEAYQSVGAVQEDVAADTYQVTFVGENGQAVTKRFSRIDYSNRGKLLYNQVTDALASMGQSISEQEKRQIIMDILKELC